MDDQWQKCDENRITCPHCGYDLHYQAYSYSTPIGISYTFPCRKCGNYMSVRISEAKMIFETKKEYPDTLWKVAQYIKE